MNNLSKISFLVLALFVLSSVNGFSQTDKEIKKQAKTEKKVQKDSVKLEKIELGKFIASPLVVPAYTPELGGLIALGMLTSFKTNPDDDLIQRSSLPVTIGYTTTGAIVFQSILTSYWFEDKLRIYGDFWYKNMPDNYWGVGYDRGFYTPVSDTTTAFNRQWFQINPQFLYKIQGSFYAGLNVDINYTEGTDAAELVENDPYYKEYNDKPFNSGLGIILQYDSRDIPINAWEGLFANVDYTYYGSYLGGDNEYSILNLDLRHYINTGREGNTFAMQARARFGFGDIPYGEMSQLGTPWDLRGYTWGQYRDNSLAFIMAEYRYTFTKPDGSLSKSGMVGWIGGGTIFGEETYEDTNIKILPNYGIGYRFELQPRMNLRIDIGLGRETMGVYFNFNEAF